MVITEPAEPRVELLGIGSKRYPSNMQRMRNKDLNRFTQRLLRVRKNQANERKVLLAEWNRTKGKKMGEKKKKEKIQECCVTLSDVLQVSISSCHSWKEQCKGIRRYITTPVTRDVVVLNRESIKYGKSLFSTEAQFMASQKFVKHKETEQGNLKSRLSMIVWVNVVLNRSVVVDSDWRFDNLHGSHLQSQSDLYHVSWWY